MLDNHKYRVWDNKQFQFLDGTFYRDRFQDRTASVVKIGPILVHFQVDGDKTVYSMPLQNLDNKMGIVTQVYS